MNHPFSQLFSVAALAAGLLGASAAMAAPPPPSYQISADGEELTDLRTGLVWRRCYVGQVWTGTTCSGSATAFVWFDAFNHANAYASSTGKAWRVPNAKELLSITQMLNLPDAPAFPGAHTAQNWSATPHKNDPNTGWYVEQPYGTVLLTGRNEHLALRLVRAAP